jgi:hypothetical protein
MMIVSHDTIIGTYFLELFNKIFQNGQTPVNWSEGNVPVDWQALPTVNAILD